MKIRIHPHARQRMAERGASEAEVIATIEAGEQFPVKLGRIGFRRHIEVEGVWQGRSYQTKQIEAIAVWEEDGWVVITVIVRYY
jgi:hypothetical protein